MSNHHKCKNVQAMRSCTLASVHIGKQKTYTKELVNGGMRCSMSRIHIEEAGCAKGGVAGCAESRKFRSAPDLSGGSGFAMYSEMAKRDKHRGSEVR